MRFISPTKIVKRPAHLFLVICTLFAGNTMQGQDLGQMAFSQLQARAMSLVDEGKLVDARPVLIEVLKRANATEGDSPMELDFPLYLIGTSFLQDYTASNSKKDLEQAMTWFRRLEKEFPESSHIKASILKRIDIHRALGEQEVAIRLIKSLLDGPFNRTLTYSEQLKLLKDLAQSYYAAGKLSEGLPYFNQLRQFARDEESKALGATGAFEALIEKKEYDQALQVIPALTAETEARHNPQFNVKLLQTSDILVEANRLSDATLLLSLTKTTDQIIRFYQARLDILEDLKSKRSQINSSRSTEDLDQKIEQISSRITQLKGLPTLQNELQIRRARNYVKTSRLYEAFWMFFDLLHRNKDDKQSEFLHYAVFSNALELKKEDIAQDVGMQYREKYPKGVYFNDVTAALAINFRDNNRELEFKELVESYLDANPLEPNARPLFAQWAAYHMERELYNDVILNCSRWQTMHSSSVFSDSLHYFKGISYMNSGDFAKAIESLGSMLNGFPTSEFTEDALMRKGFAEYYDGQPSESKETMLTFLSKFPVSDARDQALFILGEIEATDGNIKIALDYYQKAQAVAISEDIRDAVTFRIGGIYEALGDIEKMASAYSDYMQKYPSGKRYTGAVVELGRAHEMRSDFVSMLELYRDTIRTHYQLSDDLAIDSLVEAYAEKYGEKLETLTQTVALLDRLDSDTEFREKMLNDRGFLFEYFYENSEIDQPLYNRMRFHPSFGPGLMEDLSPLDSITATYRIQLEDFPSESPETLFEELRAAAETDGDRIAETRALMGLYRTGIERDPSVPFDRELVEKLGHRLLLFVADFMRTKNLTFADAAWRKVIEKFPTSDSTIVAYTRLADISREEGRLLEAFSFLDKIVENFGGSPMLPNVLLSQGDIMDELNRGPEARDIYQYILKVREWRGIVHARALFQTGTSFLNENQPDKAHGFFERTFLGYSHYVEWSAKAYLYDAKALVAMGSPSDAINTLKEAVDVLSPQGHPETYENIVSKLKELERDYPTATSSLDS